jgi:hypothetical protein
VAYVFARPLAKLITPSFSSTFWPSEAFLRFQGWGFRTEFRSGFAPLSWRGKLAATLASRDTETQQPRTVTRGSPVPHSAREVNSSPGSIHRGHSRAVAIARRIRTLPGSSGRSRFAARADSSSFQVYASLIVLSRKILAYNWRPMNRTRCRDWDVLSGQRAVDRGSSADPRFWGPRFFLRKNVNLKDERLNSCSGV